MSSVELLREAIDKLEALKAGSTRGEWVHGDRWAVAGVIPEMFGDGRCINCERMGEPAWVGERPINGKWMLAHVHESGEPLWDHGIFAARDSGPVCVINDTLEYGYIDDVDADLIVTLHRTLDAQLRILNSALRAITPVDGQASFDLGPASRAGGALDLADAILGDD